MNRKKKNSKKKYKIESKSIIFDGISPHFKWNGKNNDEWNSIGNMGDLFDKLKENLEIGIGFKFRF